VDRERLPRGAPGGAGVPDEGLRALSNRERAPGASGPARAVAANTSHAGWPKITGVLLMNRQDERRPLDGRATAGHNELLGGHGSDTIYAGDAGDVIWGDYKPSGQPSTQTDRIYGGRGNDFIYASHGRNIIDTGSGRDVVHAHFGRGEIHCRSAQATVYLSHRSRGRYRLFSCRNLSYRTLGH
jgi:Ca2+-binding RTX toxin-like protein